MILKKIKCLLTMILLFIVYILTLFLELTFFINQPSFRYNHNILCLAYNTLDKKAILEIPIRI